MKSLLNRFKNRAKKDKKIILKLITTAISRGISAFATFIFNFVLARVLGVSNFGSFILAYSILVGLGFFARFGMSSAIIRFAGIMYEETKYGQIKKLTKDTFIFLLVTSSALGLLLIIFRSYISELFFKGINVSNLLLIFAFALPFYSYQTIQSSFLKANKKSEIAPFFEIGLTLFLTAIFVGLFALWGVTLENINLFAGIIFLISSIIVVICGFIYINKVNNSLPNFKESRIENYSNFFKTLPDYALAAITNYLLKFSPTIILGYYATSKDVGLYSVANSTAFVINFILWIVSTVYAPYFANYYKQNKIMELQSLIRSSILYMTIVAIPLFIIIIVFPSAILNVFGEEFVVAKTGLIIMACAQLINVLIGPVNFLLNMTGHERNLRNIVIITAILSLSSSIILVPILGFMGAVISTAIGWIFQNTLSLFIAEKQIGIKILPSFKKKQ